MPNFGYDDDDVYGMPLGPDEAEPTFNPPMPRDFSSSGTDFTMQRAIDGRSAYGEKYCAKHGIVDMCGDRGEW